MPSSLTWLGYDNAARDRSLRILALFKEKASRDELGMGAVHDAIRASKRDQPAGLRNPRTADRHAG